MHPPDGGFEGGLRTKLVLCKLTILLTRVNSAVFLLRSTNMFWNFFANLLLLFVYMIARVYTATGFLCTKEYVSVYVAFLFV